MSNYQNRIDFISRTRQILVQYEHNCNSEKTLFMNCCVGLLIMPQQCADHDKNISVDGLVDYENWGIATSKITAPGNQLYTKLCNKYVANFTSPMRRENQQIQLMLILCYPVI